jgi:hypothetical protein
MKSALRLGAAVALACALAVAPESISFAQTAAPAPTTVSLGSYAGEVLTWLAAAFSVPIGALLVGWLLKAMRLAGVQVNGAMKEQLQATIVNGLNAAAASNAERLRGQGPLAIKSAIVADTVKYAQTHAAETIKALGLDPQSGEAVAAIKARIETAIVDPATPTPAVITPAAMQGKAGP